MKKKVMALALALCLCCGAALMTGCGQDDGKIIMGTNAEFEPFEYKTESGIVGNFDGLDIAIAPVSYTHLLAGDFIRPAATLPL